jgi:hypothetical protein
MPASAFDGPLGPSLFKVISGAPSAEELAAVTAILSAAASNAEDGTDAAGDSDRAARTADWDRPERFSPVSWMAAGRSVGS